MTTAQRRALIVDVIHRHTAANTHSRDAALRVLVEEGIYTEQGELTEEFGGEPKREKAEV
jgi:hypothetical protein